MHIKEFSFLFESSENLCIITLNNLKKYIKSLASKLITLVVLDLWVTHIARSLFLTSPLKLCFGTNKKV